VKPRRRAALLVVGASTVEEALDKAALKAEKHTAKQLDVSTPMSTPQSRRPHAKSADPRRASTKWRKRSPRRRLGPTRGDHGPDFPRAIGSSPRTTTNLAAPRLG
jgi:hypothetical protein